jgi:tetratricopeptide (TPR) repeat protein/TolB-like protein
LVTDFGVAKAVSEATGAEKLTTEGVALGTPSYMSPEQAAADPHIDHRADIYAVGVVAYELLTGRPPFLGTTPQMILSAHITDTPEPVTKYRESVPPALEQLVMKCLEKKAADRWQSAEELLPQLEALATPSGGVTPTGMMPVDRVAKRRWMMAGAAGASAVIIAVTFATILIRDNDSVFLDPDRIVVAVFENATGDPELDPVGGMAGNFITQGLQSTGIVQVVPWQTALRSSRWVESETQTGRVRDPVRALAEETGAGIVISGVIYLEGDSVQIQAEVTDAAQGLVIGSLEPVRGSQESPSDAVGDLRRRVMGFLAARIDERLIAPSDLSDDAPPFEAYRAFAEGLDTYIRVGGPEAQPFLRRAHELAPDWAEPLQLLAFIHLNLGEWAQADSLLDIMREMSGALSPYQSAYLEYTQGIIDGDNERALVAIRRAAEMAPGSRAWYNYAYLCFMTNRPRQVVAALSTLDPERGAMRGWAPYWIILTGAFHTLGEHEQELEAARRALQIQPEFRWRHRIRESRALAALGRVEELNQVLDKLVTASDLSEVHSLGAVIALRESYRILRVNLETDAAEEVLQRAIKWFEARPSIEQWHRYHHAMLFLYAEDLTAAQPILDELVEDYPHDLRYRGRRGFIAASRGDETLATQDLEWLSALDRPYLRGENTYYRGVIAGALGDLGGAVNLLRQGFAGGKWYSVDMKWDPILDPLRDHPGFQELMRPKG